MCESFGFNRDGFIQSKKASAGRRIRVFIKKCTTIREELKDYEGLKKQVGTNPQD